MLDIKNLTISSTHPCLIVYLLDQSGSMKEQFGNGLHSKSVEVAKAINELIYGIGLRCIGSNGDLKNRFELAVIGYGNDKVKSGWEGQLANKWVVSIKNVFDYPLGQNNGIPVWIRPVDDGSTPMTKAFENAKRLCNDWINWGNHRECHPPIIINITDGEATDGGFGDRDLQKEVNEIKNLGTLYGNVNILNIHISGSNGERVLFPTEVSNLNNRYAKQLFEFSTPLTENMIYLAQKEGYNIQTGAKGYIFNGNGNDLIKFLNIGTPQ